MGRSVRIDEDLYLKAEAIAKNNGISVKGYVLNEYDGSVRLVAEGSEQILLDFLRAIRLSSLGRYLTGETASWSEATGEFDAFGVKF